MLVAKAFRKVYLTSPASGYCDDSLLVEAEMYRKAAARFESERRRADALKTYRFLAREYPHSKLKPQALRAISEIEGGRRSPTRSKRAANRARRLSRTRPPRRSRTFARLRPLNPPRRRRFRCATNPQGPVAAGYGRLTLCGSGRTPTRRALSSMVDDVTRYRFERLSNPDRLFVDLSNARLGPKFSTHRMTTLPVKDDRIGQIRVAQNRRKTVRVVFDLEQPVRPDFQWLPNPERLVIDLRSATEPPLFAEERPRDEAEAPGRSTGRSPDAVPVGAAAPSQVSDSPLVGESDVATPDSDSAPSPSTSSDAAESLLAVVPGTRPPAASEVFSFPTQEPAERFVFEAPPPSAFAPGRALQAAAPALVARRPEHHSGRGRSSRGVGPSFFPATRAAARALRIQGAAARGSRSLWRFAGREVSRGRRKSGPGSGA